ncbi:transporter substrate-binding domain-containing protein [Ostreiculturibacter nitratireducens]|uniref:transporter substrate-binding domain-containing protein n=1 Tax=Ostreiculturibacter nitratireducens TaxID=3075226 RepID=UPI0031B5BE1F
MKLSRFRNTVAVTCLALSAGGHGALAQEVCATYTVQPGDMLANISFATLGTHNFQRLYSANRDVIGNNPNLIEVGVTLQIPCDGTQVSADTQSAEPVVEPETAATEEETAVQEVAAAVPSAEEVAPLESISFITADDYPPFTGEDLPGGGIMPQLVRTALVRANTKADVSIAFVNDWGSHLDTLLPSGAFDASFPWSLPECDHLGALSAADAYRCTDFDHSESFYEIVDGYFALKGSGLESAASYDAFLGKRICRPDGYSLSALTSAGISETAVVLMRPKTVAECFTALMTGEVDLAHLEVQVASDAIAKLGIKSEVIENPNLAYIKTLRVFVHKSNPHSREIIDTINSGLAIMRQSGEWFEIVSDGLRQQAQEEARTN